MNIRTASQAGFLFRLVMLVFYFFFVLPCRPIKGRGSRELCVVKTWVCVAESAKTRVVNTLDWIN